MFRKVDMLRIVLAISLVIGVVGSEQCDLSVEEIKQLVDGELVRVDEDMQIISMKAEENSQLISDLSKESKRVNKKRKEDIDATTTSVQNQLEEVRVELMDTTELRIEEVQNEFSDKLHEIKQEIKENEQSLNKFPENLDEILEEHEEEISKLRIFRESSEETLRAFKNARDQISAIMPFLKGDAKPSLRQFTCTSRSILYMKIDSAANVMEKVKIMIDIIEKEFMCKNDVEGVIREATDLIKSSPLTIENVTNLAKSYAAQGRHFGAIVLYYIRGKMANLIGNRGVSIPLASMHDIRSVAQNMEKDGKDVEPLVRTIVIPMLSALMDDIRSVKFAAVEHKIELEAWGYSDIALVYSYIHDYEEFAKMNEEGIKFLKKEFEENASKFRVLGILLNNAGAAYVNLDDLKMAEKMYAEAMTVYTTITDWPNEQAKNASVNLTQNNLRIIRNKLAQRG